MSTRSVNPQHLNARHLATLAAIADHGSFAAAARSMGLTHSAVSLHVKALEGVMGAPLLDRTRRPPTLTALGAGLVERARRLTALLDEISALGAEGETVGQVSVGVAPSVLVHLAPPALAALRAARPGLALTVQTGLSSDLVAAVKAGRLDAAVATLPEEGDGWRSPGLFGGLSVREVAREPLQVIAPTSAPEERLDELLQAHPFVWFSRRTWAGRMIDRIVAERQLILSGGDRIEVDSLEAVEALVRAGLGVSIAPLRAGAPLDPGLRRLPLGGAAASRTLGFYERPGAPSARLTGLFYEKLAAAARLGSAA